VEKPALKLPYIPLSWTPDATCQSCQTYDYLPGGCWKVAN